MLTEVDISLLLAALIVCAVSWKSPRGILWIGVAALSYINATIAWRLSLPYAEAITGMGDAAVCLAIYFWGRYRWELVIWRLFQTSVAISFLYLAGNLGVFLVIQHETYSILMEAINWLTLLLIFGNAIMQRIGKDVGAGQPWYRLGGLAMALRAQRTSPSFHRVP